MQQRLPLLLTALLLCTNPAHSARELRSSSSSSSSASSSSASSGSNSGSSSSSNSGPSSSSSLSSGSGSGSTASTSSSSPSLNPSSSSSSSSSPASSSSPSPSSSPSSNPSPSPSSSSSSSSSNLPSSWNTGIATNYGGPSQSMDPYTPSYGTSDGSCGYGVMDKSKYPYWSVAALSPSNPFYIAGPISGCGQCFEIQCLDSGGQYAGRCNSDPSQRSTTVMISDVCPECEADHLDIQALTYNKIAPMLSGRIDIQYRRVQCTPPSNLVVNIDQNSGTGGFLKMSVSTAGGSGGISSVQVKGPNTAWTGLNNLYGAEWELDTQPQLPLDLHIIADTGAEVTAFSVITQSGVTGTLPTGVQFTFSGPPSYDEASSIDSSGATAPSSSASSPASSNESAPESAPESSPESAIQSDVASASESGASQVSAYDGPNPAPPSKASPPTSAPSSSSSGSGSSCQDTAPGVYPCSQEKGWGHCNLSWMTQISFSNPKGYCAKTCGRC